MNTFCSAMFENTESFFTVALRCFKNIIIALFSIIYRETVQLQGKGHSTQYKLLVFTLNLYVLITFLVNSICVYYDTPAYFNYDVLGASIQETTTQNKSFFFVDCIIPLLFMRGIFIWYFNKHPFVYKHFYDLIVRNRDQLVFKLWAQPSRNDRQRVQNWFTRQVKLFSPHLKVVPSSAKLHYYPDLAQKERFTVLFITSFSEAYTTILQLFFIISHFLNTYKKIVDSKAFTTGQLFVFLLYNFLSRLSAYLLNILYFILPITVYLVSYIYVRQYRKVNWKLHQSKVKWCTDDHHLHHHLNSLMISRAANAYRTTHSRLTVFILRYNSSIISKCMSAYMYTMPVQAYQSVFLYNQMRNLPLIYLLHHFSAVFFRWFFFIIFISLIAKVNNVIDSKGKHLGAIFARKGILAHGFGRRRVHWVNNSEAIWHREGIKLATYYEMVWRSENELAFTAGQRWVVNWKFIADVSLIGDKKF